MRDTLQALSVDVVAASKYSFIQSAEESLIVANNNFKIIWKFNMSPRPLSLLMSASWSQREGKQSNVALEAALEAALGSFVL